MSAAYLRAKERLDALEAAFYAALSAADAYGALLHELADDERAQPSPNPELLRRFAHQQREVSELVAELEGPPLETLLRLIDRVLMIKQTEEGTFV
jgi:hypothetical protein